MRDTPADRCTIQRSFWLALDRMGCDAASVRKSAGVSASPDRTGQLAVSTAQMFAMWNILERMVGKPDPWLRFIEATEMVGHQPMFVAASHSASYADGIARIGTLKRLTMPERLEVEERGDEVAIRKIWHHPAGAEPPMSVDVSFGFLVALGREGTKSHIAPRRIELARVEPVGTAYHEHFGCPIRCGASRDELVLAACDYHRPFPKGSAELISILVPALRKVFAHSDLEDPLIERVKGALRKSLAHGRPDVSTVASDLGMSGRTLQRRITDRGTSFRAIVADARQELARELLSDPSMDICDIAGLIGFQDMTSFYRAFRNWEGLTPHRWRERALRSAE